MVVSSSHDNNTTATSLSYVEYSNKEPSSSSSHTSSSSSSSIIRRELQRIRQNLFHIPDPHGDSKSTSVGLIQTMLQQLTEFENRVVEDQRKEIATFREELECLRQKENETTVCDKKFESRNGVDNDDDDTVPSSIDNNTIMADSSTSASISGLTNERSEQETRSNSHFASELAQKANLFQIIANEVSSEQSEKLNSSKSQLQNKISAATQKLEELQTSKERIQNEIDQLKRQVQILLAERTKLIQEVEIHTHQSELAYELELAQESNDKLQSEMKTMRESAARAEERIARAVEEKEAARRSHEDAVQQMESLRAQISQSNEGKEQAVRQWERAAAEKEALEAKLSDRIDCELEEAKERAITESLVREEMQKEMKRLYEEKIACDAELDMLKRGAVRREGGGFKNNNAIGGADLSRLKREIATLRGENASLRSTAKRDSEVIAGLNDEIKSLLTVEYNPSSNDVVCCQQPLLLSCPAAPLSTNTHHEMNAMTPVANNNGVLSSAHRGSAAASRKRALVLSQGSVGEDYEQRSREFKRSIQYEPQKEHNNNQPNNNGGSRSLELISGQSRERLGSAGSGSLEHMSSGVSFIDEQQSREERLIACGSDTVGDTVSALNDADNVSLLFGQESVTGKSRSEHGNRSGAVNDAVTAKSERDGIRAHAEKLLYWANKASERSSVASSQQPPSSQQQPQQRAISSSIKYTSSIPKTIGLPPRSQSRVRKSSLLPPRCPAIAPSTSSVSDGNSTMRSDKENGGPTFNVQGEVPGAFPTATRRKKNVSVSENDTIIHNLDYMHDDSPVVCCECTVSPFSGNDPQSEFYLPKLGLACHCGRGGSSITEDRTSFSKNPTALSNILRPWQCEFLLTLDVVTADELLKKHKADANGMARRMKKWRNENDMAGARSKECYIALKIWSRTCKVVLRSIREQKEQAKRVAGGGDEGGDGATVIERPQFLDITFADTHTIASISTLGQFSSVGGDGRPFEMMEI